MVDIHLEVPKEDECLTEGTVMRVALHKESLKVGLRISMLPTMAKLLQWYWLYLALLIPNTWRATIRFFILMVWCGMEPKVCAFHAFFQVRTHPKSQGWWYVSLIRGLASHSVQ